jgi:hypothetical protein
MGFTEHRGMMWYDVGQERGLMTQELVSAGPRFEP